MQENIMEKEKDPNGDPNNMGGPVFHPDLETKKEGKKKAPPTENTEDGAVSKNSDKGAILDEDQVPPL